MTTTGDMHGEKTIAQKLFNRIPEPAKDAPPASEGDSQAANAKAAQLRGEIDRISKELFDTKQELSEVRSLAHSEMNIKLEAWIKIEGLEKELAALKAEKASFVNAAALAAGQAAEHLRHRRHLEGLVDPLRREVSLGHKSLDEFRGQLLEAGQVAETQRRTIADLTRRLDAVGSTVALVQTARDKAQHERDKAVDDLEILQAKAAEVDAQSDKLFKELEARTLKLGAAIALHAKTHPTAVVECQFCKALGR